MRMQTREIRYSLLAAAFLVAGSHGPVKAQLILDMSVLKCKDYMEAPLDRQELIAAWMSGYFNAAKNQPIVDFSRFVANKKLVEKYCKRRRNDNLMNAIKKVAF